MYFYKKIIDNLIKKKLSISFAESCTGGQLSKKLTDIPGISAIFDMGLITYSNKSKSLLLKIPPTLIKKYGAVSEKIAYQMSNNLFKISKSKICVSTTGIAGPSGGSAKKPVGLVYIGITFNNKTVVFKKNFLGNRGKIQRDTVMFCLKEISKLL
jgi:PncC family amidohydrolase